MMLTMITRWAKSATSLQRRQRLLERLQGVNSDKSRWLRQPCARSSRSSSA